MPKGDKGVEMPTNFGRGIVTRGIHVHDDIFEKFGKTWTLYQEISQFFSLRDTEARKWQKW